MSRQFVADFLRQRLQAALVSVTMLISLLLATQAVGHFLLNLNVRVFHVDHVQEGLILHMRTPMPYLVADKLGAAEGVDLPEPAPFTTNANIAGQLVHFVDKVRMVEDPLGIGRIAEDSLVIKHRGLRLRGSVIGASVHAVGQEPEFATLGEAREAMAAPFTPSSLPELLYVGDAVVDVSIRYETPSPISAYTISSQADPGLPGQEQTANLILDYGPGEPKIFRSRGLLAEPVEVSRSRLAAIGTFVWEGVRHILEGLDHVLFVVCLVLGAISFRSLLWRVTGFTVGHSATLAFGFFGYVPGADWFVPAVETGIALSIVYAAALAIRRQPDSGKPEMAVLPITVLIGLLHGLGFSFVLQEILQVTSPNIWQSLLAFNAGVELGQLFIVLSIWPFITLINRNAPPAARPVRVFLALCCIGIATVWAFERTAQLAGSFS